MDKRKHMGKDKEGVIFPVALNLSEDMPRREVEIEQKLTEHIQSFLLELGQGFAFVGR